MRIALFVLAALVLAACSSGSQTMSVTDGAVSVPVAELDGGEARHFSVDIDGKPVRFFLLKTSDGVARAAFDACDVCYQEKKGYSQNGEYMICNNCGQRFHASRINEVRGGCNPAPLERSIVNDTVVLRTEDLRQGLKYF
ncbi:DUF2318 domain-containing protein [Desulfocurvibacter africanus]|uniref:Membrane iron-sulfur containing protein FtrD-like domain-containing protein n=1 Tax=Desulfocurvibacter africanus subsp. africanus str. Walvis Bay TaxID=690850 RepID=F3Z1H7_DESAF|nr:DUF2318 domain-containing protein [Desulfocurvibacter africanus]EGJ50008.1 Protein of unknown function DUF2318, membrane [Desulfocurvibacter africanus subsp. africanus str. Walvis Bay]